MSFIERLIKWKTMGWLGNVACVEEKKNVCRILAGKSEMKRPLGRFSRGWKNNNKMDLKHIECGCRMDWSCSLQASISGCSEQHKTPSTSIKFEDVPDLLRNISFSQNSQMLELVCEKFRLWSAEWLIVTKKGSGRVQLVALCLHLPASDSSRGG